MDIKELIGKTVLATGQDHEDDISWMTFTDGTMIFFLTSMFEDNIRMDAVKINLGESDEQS